MNLTSADISPDRHFINRNTQNAKNSAECTLNARKIKIRSRIRSIAVTQWTVRISSRHVYLQMDKLYVGTPTIWTFGMCAWTSLLKQWVCRRSQYIYDWHFLVYSHQTHPTPDTCSGNSIDTTTITEDENLTSSKPTQPTSSPPPIHQDLNPTQPNRPTLSPSPSPPQRQPASHCATSKPALSPTASKSTAWSQTPASRCPSTTASRSPLSTASKAAFDVPCSTGTTATVTAYEGEECSGDGISPGTLLPDQSVGACTEILDRLSARFTCE